MQYRITHQNEGYPLLSRIIADVVNDNYAWVSWQRKTCTP